MINKRDYLVDTKIGSVYNYNELSLQGLLNKFYEEIGKALANSEQALEFVKWMKEEGLPIEVQKELELMYDDGRLGELINQTLLVEINDKVDNMDVRTRKIDNKKGKKYKENFVLNRDTYGTFENASSFSIITNDQNQRVEVEGISPQNDRLLATYGDRDSVTCYLSNTNQGDEVIMLGTTYTASSVTTTSTLTDDVVKTGMIIDTRHTPKFSGIISSVDYDNKVIHVFNWYQVNNESTGQVPSGSVEFEVNPLTKIWNINTNIHLRADGKKINGCAAEIDIINNKEGALADGIDIISKGNVDCETGVRVRVDPNKGIWKRGVHVNKATIGVDVGSTEIGVQSTNATAFSYLSNNSNVGYAHKGELTTKAFQCLDLSSREQFYMLNNGTMSSERLRHRVITTTEELNPNVPIYLSRAVENNMVKPTPDMSGLRVTLINIGSATMNVNTHTKVYNVGVSQSVTLFTDGITYFEIK